LPCRRTICAVLAGECGFTTSIKSPPYLRYPPDECIGVTADLLSAGGQHACAIATGLGIETVVIPRFSSILSAYGIACSDLTAEAAVPLSAEVTDDFAASSAFAEVQGRVQGLKEQVSQELVEQGVSDLDVEFTVTISTHYDGADTLLQIPLAASLKDDFVAAHLRETSFAMQRPVRMSNIRVRGVGKSFNVTPSDYAEDLASAGSSTSAPVIKPSARTRAFFEVNGEVQSVDTPVYVLSSVPVPSKIAGPAIIVDSTQTIVVEPNARAICLNEHVILRITTQTRSLEATLDGELSTDPIMLAVFANRFMSIAEQMGHTLQRTSISVSIKERLDFSCSIHGTDGALVANAPHIPVHLGSMQYAVQAQHNHWLGKLRPGDVLLTNHPEWGGEGSSCHALALLCLGDRVHRVRC
jgi:5-oxoprolinase (ATP-hydrolysing)